MKKIEAIYQAIQTRRRERKADRPGNQRNDGIRG